MPWQYQVPEHLNTAALRFEHFRNTVKLREDVLNKFSWKVLSQAEDCALEAEVRAHFPMRVNSVPPEPNVVWDVSSIYANKETFAELEVDLNMNAILALRECTAPGESIVAVDWQHPWYRFEPHAVPLTGDPYEWAVPVLPDGDVSLFFPSDFRFGIVGRPHSTICIYGKELLDAFERNRPLLFSRRIEWPLDS